MNLLLHIGSAKTGSTALQDFLALNSLQLFSEGVYLLGDSKTGNNRSLAACCMNKQKFNGFFHYNRIPKEEREIYIERYFRSLELEMNQLDKSIHSVVTSSEDFYGGLLEEEDISRLASCLQPMFSEIKVLIYIRPQLEMLDSLYSTFLKNGQPLSYQEFVDQYFSSESPVYNYDKGLRNWETVFGLRNVEVRIFKSTEFFNADLFDDFMQFLDLSASIEPVRPLHRLNESLCPIGQKFLLAANRQMRAFSDEKGWDPKWIQLRDYYSQRFPGKGIAERIPISDSEIVKMDDSNEKVRVRHFPDRATLFSV